MCSFTSRQSSEAGIRNLNEGQKLSFDVQTDPRSGKSAAANLQAV
jgi:cold shock protein